MAIAHRMYVYGMQMICLINIAQAYVLLTANMEDVKKLANKFVSETLAEQIADFISKVSNTDVQQYNVSEENERSQLHQVSRETLTNKSFSVGPVRNKTGTKFKQSYKISPIRTKKTYHFQNRPKSSHQYKLHPLATAHSYGKRIEPTTQRIQNSTIHHQSKQKRRTNSTNSHFETELSEIISATRESRNINNKLRSKYVTHQAESTHGFAEIYRVDRINEPDLLKFEDENKDDLKIEDEIGKSKYVYEQNKTVPSYDVNRTGPKLTSRKARTEFDQYDNFKYMKSQFIATRGFVTLPKEQPASSSEKNDYESMKIKKEHERHEHLKKQLTWF